MCKEKRRLLKFGNIHQSVCGLCSCIEMRQSMIWYVCLHVLERLRKMTSLKVDQRTKV